MRNDGNVLISDLLRLVLFWTEDYCSDIEKKFSPDKFMFVTLNMYNSPYSNIRNEYEAQFRPLVERAERCDLDPNELCRIFSACDGKDCTDRGSVEGLFSDAEKIADMRGSEYVDLCDMLEALFRQPTPTIERIFPKCENIADDDPDDDFDADDFGADFEDDTFPEDYPFFPDDEEMMDMCGEQYEQGAECDEAAGNEGSDAQTISLDMLPYLGRDNAIGTALKAMSAQKALLTEVFGQDAAVREFIRGYFRGEMDRLVNGNSGKQMKPRSVFLLAGPPGVGKTFLAERVGEHLGIKTQKFNMSEFSDNQNGVFSFCGSNKVFKNAHEGLVTKFVEKNPRSILIFDEIEKADSAVIYLFLQILDNGSLTDSFTEREVSFADTVIVFTTNAGAQLYDDGGRDLSGLSKEVILRALRSGAEGRPGTSDFPPEICSRLSTGNVIMFNHIGAGALCSIAKKELDDNITETAYYLKNSMITRDDVYSALLYSAGGEADARNIKSRAGKLLIESYYELVNRIGREKARELEIIEYRAGLPEDDSGITELFRREKPCRVLMLTRRKAPDAGSGDTAKCVYTAVRSPEKAVRLVQSGEYDVVVADMKLGESAKSFVNSVSRGSRHYAVYLITDDREAVYDLDSVCRPDGTIDLTQRPEGVTVTGELLRRTEEIACDLHRDLSMSKLRRAGKVLTYDIDYVVSDYEAGGLRAEIVLNNMKLVSAIRAEDMGSVVDEAEIPDVSFDDVIGAEDAKSYLKFCASYLANPGKYSGMLPDMPKGLLLYGPAGTGKTMLAKALAHEAGIGFVCAEGNEFLKKYVGEGAGRMHEIFAKARRHAPCILFIDEFDCIAKDRSGDDSSHVNEDVITAFFTETDGFREHPDKPVFVLAATNFDKNRIDKAVRRRLGKEICVDLPNREERLCFLRRMAESRKTFRISEGMLESLAERTPGMSLSLLDSVMRSAVIEAIRLGQTCVDDTVLDEAYESFCSGEVKKWDSSVFRRTAYHEAGHTAIDLLTGGKPAYVTVIARSGFGGYMQECSNEDKPVVTRREILARICTCLGGRAAEIAVYGEDDGVSSGASGDIRTATDLAFRMVCSYGMAGELGIAAIDPDKMTGRIADSVRRCVNRILAEQLDRAVKLLREHRELLEMLTDELADKNRLSGREIEGIFEKCSDPGAIA